MKKSLITHLCVMLVAVLVGAYLASTLITQQADITQRGDKLSKAPIGGFNKFASDIQWMLFINYAGGLGSVEKENVNEIYNRLNTILANDPNLEIAYDLGGMMLIVRDPMKAVDLFTRGANNPNLKNNWKLPFLAAHVLDRYVTDKDDPKRLVKAEDMFRLAASRNSSMPYILTALIRTRAKRIAKRGKWNNKKVANRQHAYLCALYDEWRKGGGRDSNDGSASGESLSIDIKPMLLQAAQNAKASGPTNKDILETIDMVMKKVLEDQHLCSKCLAAYSAGDKFCGQCGVSVQVYGVCTKCNAVLKGKYCTKCGAGNKRK
jgi:hypothetical protein